MVCSLHSIFLCTGKKACLHQKTRNKHSEYKHFAFWWQRRPKLRAQNMNLRNRSSSRKKTEKWIFVTCSCINSRTPCHHQGFSCQGNMWTSTQLYDTELLVLSNVIHHNCQQSAWQDCQDYATKDPQLLCQTRHFFLCSCKICQVNDLHCQHIFSVAAQTMWLPYIMVDK